MKVYAYHITPMDIGWEMMPTLDQVIREASKYKIPHQPLAFIESTQYLLNFAALAFKEAEKVGWEGDFRPGHEPRVFFIPNEVDVSYGLVWKQDNNGATFVISPVPMPHLQELSLV
jgi:hypothetical protein